MPIALRWLETGAGEVCRRVLDTLPAWFGRPETTASYVAMADREPTVIARVSESQQDAGFLTLLSHSQWAAEIYVMGVMPAHHRSGIGRALLTAAEARLTSQGALFLQVKTLSERHPDPGYAATRAFYSACGFRVLEELPELWGEGTPAVQLCKALPTATA